jgi:hypothetical protein
VAPAWRLAPWLRPGAAKGPAHLLESQGNHDKAQNETGLTVMAAKMMGYARLCGQPGYRGRH